MTMANKIDMVPPHSQDYRGDNKMDNDRTMCRSPEGLGNQAHSICRKTPT